MGRAFQSVYATIGARGTFGQIAVGVAVFKGPYSGLSAAYDRLYCTWLPASGQEAADQPAYEVYLNDPTDTAPDDLLTEIVLPLV